MKIVITGAESTGKSTLAEGLATHFNGLCIPEIAREYVENLGRHYTMSDIEIIARKQIESEKINSKSPLIFFDTWLILTKVWFDFLYGKHPNWLDKAIEESKIDLFLLCDIDIPWLADPVRENGGENRAKLNEIYFAELERYGFNYRIVRGNGEERLLNGIKCVNELFVQDKV